ncbi:FadR/GntR family transcriptional regulator [Glutamicibacter arilaitensis]|uniref:FadR/GntR family transcriptional regulator n=1 Tax=Glutamicibacter arilaitensis TaxID=256701 RepID=UPI00384B0F82
MKNIEKGIVGACITASAMPSPCVAKVLRDLRAHKNRPPEIVEARSTLEVKLVALAAEPRTEADLEKIDQALVVKAEEISGGGRGARGDELFHEAVTGAAKSAVMQKVMSFIAEMVLETHHKIATAIRAGDASGATEAMQEHTEMVSDVPLLKEDEA